MDLKTIMTLGGVVYGWVSTIADLVPGETAESPVWHVTVKGKRFDLKMTATRELPKES